MKNEWHDPTAEEYSHRYIAQGLTADHALRMYTSHLIGQNKELVIHGGGNSSLKFDSKDILGNAIEVLWVKGSGQNMATIKPSGMTQVELSPLLRLKKLHDIDDFDLVNQQRRGMLDQSEPNPSVETLLHAFIPEKFVDHSHSQAILSITNQEDGSRICKQIFGDRVGIVPYIRPGFGLAKAAAEQYHQNPNIEGLILLHHGIFTFGATAKESYDRMIDLCTTAEKAIAERSKAKTPPAFTAMGSEEQARAMNILRGSLQTAHSDMTPMVLTARTNQKTLEFAQKNDLDQISQRGVATPDHLLWTKSWPILLPSPIGVSDLDYKEIVNERVKTFSDRYKAWFDSHNSSLSIKKIPLDPLPRLAVIEGLGIIGIGPNQRAANIAADIYETSLETMADADGIGQFRSISSKDSFEFEYWSLEQAKLGKKTPLPLNGQVVVVTGGAGAIGRAIAQNFKQEGAEVVILDINQQSVDSAKEALNVKGYICDVLSRKAIEEACHSISIDLGGIDIVVSNAGRALAGKIGEIGTEELRAEFDLNFFSHQEMAQAALKVFRRQGFGGQILFNLSKQAINPGPDFGAYGTPKAAALFLMRQYAVDHSSEGIRVNGVNADRIRSGLLTEGMVAQRAKSRGLTEDQYMSGNLLGREVQTHDVAEAFTYLAKAQSTTGCIITVDGGNPAAALR